MADAVRECGSALAIEVALETVADRFVQQNAGPTRAQNHGHGPRRRRHRLQIHQRLAYRLTTMDERLFAAQQLLESEASAAAAVALLTAAIVLDDDRYVQAHQRTYVRRERAVARGDQYDLVDCGQRGHDLFDPRIDAPRVGVNLHQPRDLLLIANRVERIDGHVQSVDDGPLPCSYRIAAAAAGDCAGRVRGFHQRRQQHLVRVGKAGLFTADGAYTHALLDAVRPFLDDAVLQRPRLFARQLKIKIRIIDAPAHHRSEHRGQPALVETRRSQNHSFRDIEYRSSAHAGTVTAAPRPSLRLSSAGKRARVSACFARSMSAVITPLPFAKRDSTWPQ